MLNKRTAHGILMSDTVGWIFLAKIEKHQISDKTQQQKMNRVEPVEEVFHFQVAFFSVVEKDGHEGQGSGELILHDEGSGEALDRAGIADQKQGANKENAPGAVVGLEEPAEVNAGGHNEKLEPVVPETVYQHHDQHTEKQREEYVLFVGVKPVVVDRVVEGNLRDQDEDSEPQQVFQLAVGVYEAFHQKKTVDGESDTADVADQPVEYKHIMVQVCIRLDSGKL